MIVRYYVVRFLHERGVHRFCRRTFTRNEDPWQFNTASATSNRSITYTLYGGQPPKEVHSP